MENAGWKTNWGLRRRHRGTQVPLHYCVCAQVSPLRVVMHLQFSAICGLDFQHFMTKCMVLIWITDIGTFGFESDDVRTEIQRTDPFGRDLGAPIVVPKCTIFSFFFSFPFGNIFGILLMLFTRFKMQSYKSKGPNINLYEEKLGFERQDTGEMKTRVKTLFQRLSSFIFGFS